MKNPTVVITGVSSGIGRATAEKFVQRAVAYSARCAIRQKHRLLVNSAGVTLLGAMEETSVAEAQTLFDTKLFGLLRTTKAVLSHMREQRSGRIVNVSSVLGFLPAPYTTPTN